jgi:hypothetical protein
MQSVLVFIEGTITGFGTRAELFGTPSFYDDSEMMKDTVSSGSVACLNELAQVYDIVYIGARPPKTLAVTQKWLKINGFPDGEIVFGCNQAERMESIIELKKRKTFYAGIGDRWDDNELHLELGCKSIILKECEGNWDIVRKYLLQNPAE